jgi:hypothetical protein
MTGENAAPPGRRDPLVVECPLREHAVEVVVVADDDVGLADECVELRAGGKVLRGKTDGAGRIRFEGLKPGTVELGLYKLDGAAWEKIASLPLPPERDVSTGTADWQPDAGNPPASLPSRTVRAAAGESIATIAVAHGFTPGQLWAMPQNQAATAGKQQQGEVLTPDQVVVLPAWSQRWERGPVGHCYYLHRIGVPFSLTIRLLDGSGKPRRKQPYLLRVSRRNGLPDLSHFGRTDLDGYLVESIRPDATSGELQVRGEDTIETHRLRFAALAPVSVPEGVEQRLANLGFLCGSGGLASDETRNALRRFQQCCGLVATGEADDQTRALLFALHQS